MRKRMKLSVHNTSLHESLGVTLPKDQVPPAGGSFLDRMVNVWLECTLYNGSLNRWIMLVRRT